MTSFIDEHRGTYGVESICGTLPIAPSTYYEHKLFQARPDLRSARARRDDELKPEIANYWSWPELRSTGDGLAPAGSYAPNGYGLHDMAGNAGEWVADWYDAGYYERSPLENPAGPE